MIKYTVILILLCTTLPGVFAQEREDDDRRLIDRAREVNKRRADRKNDRGRTTAAENPSGESKTEPVDTTATKTASKKAPYFAVFTDISLPQYRLNEMIFDAGMPTIGLGISALYDREQPWYYRNYFGLIINYAMDSNPGIETSRLTIEPFTNSNFQLLIIGLSVPVVTDFKNVSPGIAPKIGVGLVNVVNLYTQYNWHFLDSRFSCLQIGVQGGWAF